LTDIPLAGGRNSTCAPSRPYTTKRTTGRQERRRGRRKGERGTTTTRTPRHKDTHTHTHRHTHTHTQTHTNTHTHTHTHTHTRRKGGVAATEVVCCYGLVVCILPACRCLVAAATAEVGCRWSWGWGQAGRIYAAEAARTALAEWSLCPATTPSSPARLRAARAFARRTHTAAPCKSSWNTESVSLPFLTAEAVASW